MDNTQLVLLAVAIAVALGAGWWWYISRKVEPTAPTYTETVMPPATRAVAAEPPLLSVPSFVRAESLGEPEGQTAKALFNTHVEREDLGGGKFRDTIHIKKIAHRRNGTLRRIRTDWAQGDANFPHVALDADTLCYTAADGMRRLCPTGDPQRYFEIGAPRLYQGSKWQKINLGQATRSANRISWQTANADLNIIHGGHFVKLEIPLKNGWLPPTGRVAFPVGLNGLTRNGSDLLADGQVVMRMNAPNVYDAANPMDVRDVGVTFPLVGGQRYALLTLPDLTGMQSPVIDPTFTDGPSGDVTTSKDDRVGSGVAATKNYGLDENIATNPSYKGLLRFDCSSIDSASTCSSATLYLYKSSDPGSSEACVVTFYSIASGNAAWIEGTKNNATAGAGEPCWNALAADGAGGVTTAWAGSAGLATSGTDYEASALGTMAVERNDAVGTEYTSALTTARIGGWFGAVNTNYGLLLVQTTGAWLGGLASSDHATAGYRPKLVVEYTEAATGNPFIVRAPIPSWCH